jgi:fatty acid desaturase
MGFFRSVLATPATTLVKNTIVFVTVLFVLWCVDTRKPRVSPAEWAAGATSALVSLYASLIFVAGFDLVMRLSGSTVLADNRPRNDEQVVPSAPKAPARPQLKPAEGARPPIAWPTVVLAVASVGLWAWGMHMGATGRLSRGATTLVCGVATYVAFTPLHDATHSAVAPRYPRLNDAVGLLASLPFMGIFRVFRTVHLAHHAHCNVGKLDPDHWAGEGPPLLLPLRWLTVMPYYSHHVHLAAEAEERRAAAAADGDAVPTRWRTARRDIDLAPGAFLAALWWLFEAHATLWQPPFFLATAFLMYSFDYVPHRPHKTPHRVDPYAATSVAVLSTALPEGHLTIPWLAQNYHNIHHLWPTLPFYRYASVWRAHRDTLLARGTKERSLFSRVGATS